MNRSQGDNGHGDDVRPVRRNDRTIDSATFARVTQIAQRFMEAWQRALTGAAPPRIETFVNLGTEEERPLLIAELQEIQQTYQDRISTQASGKVGKTAVFSSPPTAKEDPPEQDPRADPFATAASVPGEDGELDSKVALPSGPPPVRITGYEILGRLGHGGMGVVYKVRHVKLDRIEALKMVLAGAHAAPEQFARFRSEAQSAAQLQHPNIVQVHEVGEVDGLPYFSLEYVGGDSLAKKLGGQPQPPQEAAHLVQTLAGAIEFAHRHSVLHRDLKPANILLTEDGVPKITDFGLAKRLEADSTQTRSGTILGTPSYMAPEQARGQMKTTGPATDVYGLGTILYECLTGRAPFVAATQVETIKLVIEKEPVAPSRLRPGVPRDLETICLKCLQKDPAKRYPSAAALARDLGHFLSGEPIEARPVGKAERLWRWCRRNPGVSALGAAVFVLLAAVAVTSTALLVRIAREKAHTERERNAAEAARDQARENEIAARAAEKRAETSARLAAEQGALVSETIAKMVTKVQTQLRSQPGNQRLRQEIIGDAVGVLKRVVGNTADDPHSRWVRTAAYQHMGDIARDLGRTEEALAHYRECQRITEQMELAHPDGQLTKWNLAIVYDKLGDTNHQLLGDGVVARDYYLKSLDRRRELAEGPLTAPDLKPAVARSNLAATHSKLGELALAMGNPSGAWEQYRKYLEIQTGRSYSNPREALAEAGTPDGEKLFPPGLANKMSDLSFHLGDVETARGWTDRAVRLSRDAVKRSKSSARDRQILATILGSAGDKALQSGSAAAAKSLYAQAHALVVERKTEDASSVGARRALSLSHYRLGAACRALGEANDADEHFRKCLTLRETMAKEDPANVFTQIDLALALARVGRYADAADRSAKFLQRAPKDPALCFYAGCVAALCSTAAGTDQGLRDRYVGESVLNLTRAVESGYRDVTALEHDPDLDPVRDDPRVRELIRQLRSANGPPAAGR